MIEQSTNIKRALRLRQRGFLLNPYRFAGGGGATDPNFANVSLLLHFDGANGSTTFTDSSSNGFTPTVNGNTQISTAQSKFGSASGLFDGSGDWLYYAPDTAFDFSGNFTFEFFVRWVTVTNGGIFQLFPGTPPGSLGGLALGYDGSAFQIYSNNLNSGRTFSVSSGVWYHLALVRQSSSITLYVDGVAQGASVGDSTNYLNNGLNIGLYFSSSFTFNGYMDEIRVTKGIARYTANFTPPTAPFPDS
jgi:hypothetical protein